MRNISISTGQISRQLLAMILVAIVALAGGIGLSRLIEMDGTPPDDLQGTLFPAGREMEDFSLQDHNHEAFTNARLKNHWTFMFFGFTNCPDVCPTTMKVMQSILKQIPDSDEHVPMQMVFVSVDPNRDPPDLLKSYVTYYHPDFLGVTAPLENLILFTHSLGILFAYNSQGKTDGSYTVDHSAQIILFDPEGNWRGVFSPPHSPAKMSETFLKIRDWYGG